MIDHLSPQSKYLVLLAVNRAHSHAAVSHYPLLSQQEKKPGVMTSVVQYMTPMTPPAELETAKADEDAGGKWYPRS